MVAPDWVREFRREEADEFIDDMHNNHQLIETYGDDLKKVLAGKMVSSANDRIFFLLVYFLKRLKKKEKLMGLMPLWPMEEQCNTPRRHF